MDVFTRKMPATDTRGARISVSNGQGTTAHYPWDFALDTLENHVSAAVVFAREQLGMTNVVTTRLVRRPTADGYVVTLSHYIEKEA